MRLVIIGGSDAGIAAALRARALAPEWEVVVVLGDEFPNFSICGLPYWIGGEVSRSAQLAHRTREDLEDAGMQLRTSTWAQELDVDGHTVALRAADGTVEHLEYDRLILGTGADPVLPPIPGVDLPRVHLLHHMEQAFALQASLESVPEGGRALIVGAGYIGLEMAEALVHRGLAVTLVERLSEVLPTVDPELGALVRAELEDGGVDVRVDTALERFEARGDGLRAHTADGGVLDVDVDVAVVCVGVRPNVDLAVRAGARTGIGGALAVDAQMRTGLPDVWAAGDCVHTHHQLLHEPGYLPLGTTAHKQGRIAGENAVGGARTFRGSLGTQVLKVMDLAAARTGLLEREAEAIGLDVVTVASVADDHKRYMPGARPVLMRWTAERTSGRLIGCQLLGPAGAEVAKRIDTVAAALHAGWTIDELSDLDLAYTPPFGSPWDALQIGAQAWTATTTADREALSR